MICNILLQHENMVHEVKTMIYEQAIKKLKKYLVICLLIRTFASDYEKSRNEKSRNMENPFKFGTIVENEFFTDRIKEVAYIRHFVDSANHLILISPRRFGKSSVVWQRQSRASTIG